VNPSPSLKLEEIGLQLLKFVSSHRDLEYVHVVVDYHLMLTECSLDNWDEYVRRQYRSKMPDLPHPYGDEDEPKKFRSMNIYVKMRILQQLTVWTFWNQDRIRQAMPEQRDTEQYDEWVSSPFVQCWSSY